MFAKKDNKKETTPESSQKQTLVDNKSTPQPPQNQEIASKENKNEDTPEPSSQKHKIVKREGKKETTPKSQRQNVVKNENTPSPFSLANHSRQHKPPKPTPKPEATFKATPTPCITKVRVPAATSCKKEPTDDNDNPPPSTANRPPSTKRAFIDLSNDMSSDDEDEETPSKQPKVG